MRYFLVLWFVEKRFWMVAQNEIIPTNAWMFHFFWIFSTYVSGRLGPVGVVRRGCARTGTRPWPAVGLAVAHSVRRRILTCCRRHRRRRPRRRSQCHNTCPARRPAEWLTSCRMTGTLLKRLQWWKHDVISTRVWQKRMKKSHFY